MATEPPIADEKLIDDALAIWHAGVRAVHADQLIKNAIKVDGNDLWIGDQVVDLRSIGRIAIVGAGKAGAGMTLGLEQSLGEQIIETKRVQGWINVPADCVRPLRAIHLHPARPAGSNEPTADGVSGTERILEIVRSLTDRDLCIVLLSGGGSALLPAPKAGITLADKLAVTKFLSGAGANIEELNTVRKQLSLIKGGGLARDCRAGKLITLVISDVIGDPPDIIASGPTVLDDSSTPERALAILESFGAQGQISSAVFEVLKRATNLDRSRVSANCENSYIVIGNNAVAVDGAGIEAVARGYSHAMVAATKLEADAESVGRALAEQAWKLRFERGPDCLITGGEPVVRLVPAAQRGKGGRNQQLVLAAVERLMELTQNGNPLDGIVILSGGTDGEDGPTDAAGAYFDSQALEQMSRQGLSPQSFLHRNDAYHFFQALNRLIITGPTHTNVCDLRVVVVTKGIQSRK